MQTDLQNTAPQTSTAKKIFAVLLEIACIIYGLSPIDAVPDIAPIAGYLDDIGLNLAALLNLYQAFSGNQQFLMVKIAKYVKWILFLSVLGLALFFGGIIALIIAVVSK